MATKNEKVGFIKNNLFYINHLNCDRKEDVEAIKNFYIENKTGYGLQRYLQEYACVDESESNMRTYIVRYMKTDECVGYFSLKAGLISLNETKSEIFDGETGREKKLREFDTVPGVELANFAVNSSFVSKYPYIKGIGQVIFVNFIIPVIREAALHVGIKVIYIFALPYDSLINAYKRYGFRRLSITAEKDLHNRLKPRYDESCKFMYQML